MIKDLTHTVAGAFAAVKQKRSEEIYNGKIVPRKSQLAALNQYCTDAYHRHYELNMPTASGKTILGTYIASIMLDQEPELKVIFVTSRNNIGAGYAEDRLLSLDGYEDMVWSVGYNLCTGVDEGKRQTLNTFLTQPVIAKPERVCVCTHVTFAVYAENNPTSKFKNTLVVIDESHHLAHDGDVGNKLGSAVNKLLKNDWALNIYLVVKSATMFRADQNPLIPENHRHKFGRYSLAYDEYFEQTQHIRGFDYRFILSGQTWDLALDNVKIKPGDKTIVFLPSEGHSISFDNKTENVKQAIKGLTGKRINSVKQGLIKAGNLTILDLVHPEHQEKGIKYLREHPNDVDIILSVKVTEEGFDWPPCNKLVIVGQRNSLTQLLQLMGRAFRDHENKHNDKAQILHVFPDLDLKKNSRDVFNGIMKALDVAMLMQEVVSPLSKIKSLRKNKKALSWLEMLQEYGYTQHDIEQLMSRMRFVDDGELTPKERNVLAMNKIKQILIDDGVSPDDAEFVARGRVISAARQGAVIVKGFSGLDMSNLDFDLLEEFDYTSSLAHVCGFSKTREFWEFYNKEMNSGEAVAIERCKELINYKKENEGKNPPEKSSSGRWLYTMRQAKKGNGRCVWYSILDKMAADAGYPGLFDAVNINRGEAAAIERCKELINYKQQNEGKNPPKESFSGWWLNQMRQAKKRNGRSTWYPILDKLAADAGYPGLFDTTDLEKEAIERCKELINYKQQNEGKNPSRKSFSGRWLYTMRQTKKRNGRSTWYPILDKMAEDAGYPGLFDAANVNSREAAAIERCKELINYKQQNEGKNPPRKGRWLYTMRQAKKGNNAHTWYPILDKMAEDAGYPGLFDACDASFNSREKEAIKKCQELINYKKENNGKNPHWKSSSRQWLKQMRQTKKGNRNSVWYPILDELVADAGYPGLFDTRK